MDFFSFNEFVCLLISFGLSGHFVCCFTVVNVLYFFPTLFFLSFNLISWSPYVTLSFIFDTFIFAFFKLPSFVFHSVICFSVFFLPFQCYTPHTFYFYITFSETCLWPMLLVLAKGVSRKKRVKQTTVVKQCKASKAKHRTIYTYIQNFFFIHRVPAPVATKNKIYILSSIYVSAGVVLCMYGLFIPP